MGTLINIYKPLYADISSINKYIFQEINQFDIRMFAE